MVKKFFVFTQPRYKPLSQLIGRRTAKDRLLPVAKNVSQAASSLKQPPRFLHKHFFHDPGRYPGT